MYAQGGIAAVLSEDKKEVASHLSDTLVAGAGLCREEAAQILVEEGAKRAQELIDWGACFDQSDGQFLLAKEAAHSQGRILRARGDATGDEIVKTLVHKVRALKNFQVLDGYFTVDLLVQEGVCRGALLLEEVNSKPVWVFAEQVILTTGGVGQVYLRTTNPPVATGDGIAMAHRAGALVEDMEFIQFHPTALFVQNAPCFLLSETMRGEGGILRNHSGRAFMSDYDPAAELAPRDRVARAIWEEMGEERNRPIFLDLSHLDPNFVRNRFPTIYRTCHSYGIDITKDRVPVAPAAHYVMGGIKTDTRGRTSLPGLLAAGEVACTGVHGANRLASNALLEGLVFGTRSGKTAVEDPAPSDRPILNPTNIPEGNPILKEEIHQARSVLMRQMWEKAGIVREERGLSQTLEFINLWLHKMNAPPLEKPLLETRNLLVVASLIIIAALQRKESIGAHFRKDFPDPPGYPHHITQ